MENKKKNIEEKCLEQALKAGLKDRGETKRILQELVGEEIERLNTERPDFIKRHFSKSKCEKDTIVGIEHFRADHLSVLKQNGDIASFTNGVLDHSPEKVPVDEILIDGKSQGDIGELVLKDREMLGENGIVIISCTLDKHTKEILGGPEILTRGFVYVKESQDLLEHTKELAKEAIEALKKVGLNEDIYCKNPLDLSGGEKRRAALAGIIAAKPKYLILDEPTSGLDQKGKDDLYKLLLELYNDGINILIVTHDMDTVLKICDDVILMSNGSIVKHCDTLEFFKDKQIENYGIKIPKIFDFCNEFDKNFSNIRCLDDFIKELKNHAK